MLKFPLKGLYTYNVRAGDSFILDEKAPLPKVKTGAKASGAGGTYSTSPKVYGVGSPSFPSVRNAVTFAAINPKTFGQTNHTTSKTDKQPSSSSTRSQNVPRGAAAAVARNVIERLPAQPLEQLAARRWRTWLDV